eukprot:3714059-Lingulodinium_polyedra.AAC.1
MIGTLWHRHAPCWSGCRSAEAARVLSLGEPESDLLWASPALLLEWLPLCSLRTVVTRLDESGLGLCL